MKLAQCSLFILVFDFEELFKTLLIQLSNLSSFFLTFHVYSKIVNKFHSLSNTSYKEDNLTFTHYNRWYVATFKLFLLAFNVRLPRETLYLVVNFYWPLSKSKCSQFNKAIARYIYLQIFEQNDADDRLEVSLCNQHFSDLNILLR